MEMMLCFLEAGGGRNSCRNSVIDGTELSTGVSKELDRNEKMNEEEFLRVLRCA